MSQKINGIRLAGIRLGAALPLSGGIDRKVVVELFDHIDALGEDIKRLQGNVVQLQGDLQNAHEAKKVVLPKEVAEAIERFKNIGCSLPDIIYTFASGADKPNIHFADYAADNFETLLSALVNGYTVEEPTAEDKIATSITKALEDMQVKSPVPVERLAKVLTLAVREVLAEDRQEE